MSENVKTTNGKTAVAMLFAAGIMLFAAFAVNGATGPEKFFDGAEWIGEAPGLNAAAPRFSTTFTVAKDGPAKIAICGLGQYVATLNGKPLGRGDEFNLPGWTRTTKTCFYNVFSPVLKAGEANALEITLGNGMYNVEPPGKGLYTKFTGSEGPKKLIVGGAVKSSVDGWTVSPSEVVRTHVYCGDDIDHRFSAAEAKREKPVRVPAPAGELIEAPFTCRLQEVKKPVRIMKVSDEELTVDFGQNAAYVPKIVAAGPRASRVEIEFSEIPLAPGETRITKAPGGYRGKVARCAFTLAGTGDESFAPPFFYYGFRYMKVRLVPAAAGGALPRLVDAEARVVMADAPPAGSFSCSLGLFNKIHDICRWSQRSNMQSVFTDCPHREKLGWQEQNHIHSEQIRWGWNAETLFAKTCRDLADSQLSDGMVPDIAPEYTVFKGGFRHSIEWGSAVIQIPWQQYEWTGDDSLIREYWKNMVAYHEYIRSKSQDGKRGLFITPGGLGDWYQQTVSSAKRPARRTSHDFTATAFYYLNAVTLANSADLLGRKAEAAAFREEAAKIKKAFNAKWWNAEGRYYENNSQTANALALAFGLADPGDTAAIVSNIVEDVHGRGAVGTGEIGYPYLLKALMDNGRGDVIFDMTADDTKPGYGYMIAKGNTTCHEAWDCRENSSFNHFMMADIVNWFYSGLGGIKRTSPGFKTFTVQPEFHPGLDWVKASHAVKGGEIRVEWRRTAAGIEVVVAVPKGTVAEIRLPGLPETRMDPGERTFIVQAVRRPLDESIVERHFAAFAAADEELFTNTVDNAHACGFMKGEIPLFECPDEDITRTYYFRWWTFRKHLRKTPRGWVVTEFLPPVGWAGAENTISCAMGHHLREGRWMRTQRFFDDYTRFMLAHGTVTGPRSYVSWPAWATLERAKVSGDRQFAIRMLPAFVTRFDICKKGWKLRALNTAQNPETGLFMMDCGHEGTEMALSPKGARVMVNSAMWAEADAIAAIARMAGDAALAARFEKEAGTIRAAVVARLWNAERAFFTAVAPNGRHDGVRELHGYAPFYFRMPLDESFLAAWKPLMREDGFHAPHGLTFPERSARGFRIDRRGHECKWNGPSWPYSTSIALTALYGTLQGDSACEPPVSQADFAALVKQYAAAHVMKLKDGRTVPWIDENLEPFTGEWLARAILRARPVKRVRFKGERGKDYNHSTFCDLVIAGLCGFVPHEDGLIEVKPLAPREWDWWCLKNVRYHGNDVTISFDRDGTRYGRGKGLAITVDEKGKQQ